MDLENKETRLRYLEFLYALSICCVGLSVICYFCINFSFMIFYLIGDFDTVVRFGILSIMMIFWVGGIMFYQIVRLYRRILKLSCSRRQVKRKQLKQISLYKRIIVLAVGQVAWSVLWVLSHKLLWA